MRRRRGRERDDGLRRDRDGLAAEVSVAEYFQQQDRRELIFGHVRRVGRAPVVRDHIVSVLMAALVQHRVQQVDSHACALPDVVLDQTEALVLHPALAVVVGERLAFVRERIWGAPNLVVEVLDDRTARRIRLSHVRWYRLYGVEECWLVDPRARKVDVVDFQTTSLDVPIVHRMEDELRSRVLRRFSLKVGTLLAGAG